MWVKDGMKTENLVYILLFIWEMSQHDKEGKWWPWTIFPKSEHCVRFWGCSSWLGWLAGLVWLKHTNKRQESDVISTLSVCPWIPHACDLVCNHTDFLGKRVITAEVHQKVDSFQVQHQDTLNYSAFGPHDEFPGNLFYRLPAGSGLFAYLLRTFKVKITFLISIFRRLC